jgi:hypothetical protein
MLNNSHIVNKLFEFVQEHFPDLGARSIQESYSPQRRDLRCSRKEPFANAVIFM